MLSALFSAILTFTATATGVEKGAPVEFIFAGSNSDRAYEALFLLDEPIADLCKRIEAIVPRGKPVSTQDCHLWPTGCRVRFEPTLDTYINYGYEQEKLTSVPIYTGGTRLTNDTIEANTVMPAAFFATYSLAQAPIVYHEPMNQGVAYGRFTAAIKLEKGSRHTFKMIINEKSIPPHLDLIAEKGQLPHLLQRLKAASSAGEIDAKVSFSDALTVEESIAVARALAVIDSSRVKLNGADGLFYRAFLPLEKWRDRQERLQQPFELTLNDDGTDALLFIEEDWTVEGPDPKLTPRQIAYDQITNHTTTTTCFIYAAKTQTVSRLSAVMKKFPKGQILNWYVFQKE